MSASKRIEFTFEDGVMAGWHWSNPDHPRLVFAHANGFNAYTYRQMFDLLSDRFDILALDLRGHGRTTLPANPKTHHSWVCYAQDLQRVFKRLDRPVDLLAGHSMGAASMMMAAARLEPIPQMAFIEPVILPTAIYGVYYAPFGHVLMNMGNPMSAQARRRNNHWPDREAVLARYKSRAPFSFWADGVIEDYLADGLKEDGTGLSLACDPDWEAANYEAQRNPVLSAAAKIGGQASVYQAETGSTVMNAAALKSRGVKVEAHKGLSHLAPMEDPEGLANWIMAKWESSHERSD